MIDKSRIVWGILLKSKGETIGPLYCAWKQNYELQYTGEPSRPLIFNTRKQAREYCRDTHARWLYHPHCSQWRFSVVKLIESLSST